jgi:hypothetical protein
LVGKWEAGDVVGCFLDFDRQTMSFSLNTKKYGDAFKFALEEGKGLNPGATFAKNQQCTFCFGAGVGELAFPPGTCFLFLDLFFVLSFNPGTYFPLLDVFFF